MNWTPPDILDKFSMTRMLDEKMRQKVRGVVSCVALGLPESDDVIIFFQVCLAYIFGSEGTEALLATEDGQASNLFF